MYHETGLPRLNFFRFLAPFSSSSLAIVALSGSISRYLYSLAIILASSCWNYESWTLYSKIISKALGSILSNSCRVFTVKSIFYLYKASLSSDFLTLSSFWVISWFEARHSFYRLERLLRTLYLNISFSSAGLLDYFLECFINTCALATLFIFMKPFCMLTWYGGDPVPLIENWDLCILFKVGKLSILDSFDLWLKIETSFGWTTD